MSIKYEDESIGQRCLATLERLIRTTQEELIGRAKALWNKVTDLMEKDLEHYIISFTQCQSGKLSVRNFTNRFHLYDHVSFLYEISGITVVKDNNIHVYHFITTHSYVLMEFIVLIL
jgi:hypothetical protein